LDVANILHFFESAVVLKEKIYFSPLGFAAWLAKKACGEISCVNQKNSF